MGRNGRAEPFVGEIFKAQLSFRADRASQGYEFPGAKSTITYRLKLNSSRDM